MSLRWLVLLVACSSPKPLVWAPDETHAFERARTEHKGVMLEFYARWAMPSEELRHELSSAKIAGLIAPAFVPVTIDVSDDSDASQAQRARYNAQTIPYIVFVTTSGKVVERVDRLIEADALTNVIEHAASLARE